MTDGRYESTYAKRPNGFDQRLLWTNTHPEFQPLDPEVRYKESCPYHDLKANGQFQPEPALPLDRDGAGRIAPGDLCKRAPGKPMNTSAAKNSNFGCGGVIIPEETEPLPPPVAVKRSGKPWTSTSKNTPHFSTAPYVSCPPAPPVAPPVEPHFHTGASNSKMGLPYAYMPDEAQKLPPPTSFRLKAGTYKPTVLPPMMADASPTKTKRVHEPKKKKDLKPRQPFVDSKSMLGTFGHYPRHIPEPYTDASLKKKRGGTLFTYWAKSKRCAPVNAPWSTMVQTNEPVREGAARKPGSQ